MDIVLEAVDTFILDRMYAELLPVIPSPVAYNAFEANATYNNYQFTPASQYISFTPSKYAYMSSLPRDNIWRQTISLFLITWLFGAIVYFVFSTLSYVFIFDKETFNHPKYLKNQVRMEIRQTLGSLPWMAVFTAPFFVAEVRGYSNMYDTTDQGPGMWYNVLQFPIFILFTDMCIYWIHRGLHHPLVYKHLHKPHHKWIVPTPYASHAFHPVDGFSQSIPYHVFPFLFPLQKYAYVLLFVFINVWTILIHDGEYLTNSPIINGAACHSGHHMFFSVNYGQFTTLWDRIGGSYRKPSDELFKRETKMSKAEWQRQRTEMEKIVKEVEGEDDRTYLPDDKEKKQQ